LVYTDIIPSKREAGNLVLITGQVKLLLCLKGYLVRRPCTLGCGDDTVPKHRRLTLQAANPLLVCFQLAKDLDGLRA
jgi:hypothetical protein